MKPTALYYLGLLDDIRAVAKGMGYAVGLHGSMVRDFDLIACPWSADARPAEELVRAIAKCVGADVILDHFEEKPHGRRAWSIRLNDDVAVQRSFNVPLGTAVIDLSVMPRMHASTYPVADDLFPTTGVAHP